MDDIDLLAINDSQRSRITISKWFFFLVFSYFFLYCNMGQFLTSFLFEWIYSLVVPPFASLFGEENLIRVDFTGSGDTTFDYYKVLFIFSIAFIASFLLLFLMRKEKWIGIFGKVVFMLVRYFLIYQFIIYGLSKVFYLQFQYPNDYLLERKLGDMSPMGLMWTFMGYSKGYTMLVGWLELLAGVFIVFRRTMILGALMVVGVMMNVFMMNMCYDVPVKLLSFHMTLMGLFLLFPVRKEVFGFLFSRDEVVRNTIPFFDYGSAKKGMFWLKVSLLAFMLISMSVRYVDVYKIRNTPTLFSEKQEVLHFEIYNDVFFEKWGQDDAYKWKSFNFVGAKRFRIQYEDDSVMWYDSVLDEENQIIKIKRNADTEYKTLRYTVDSTGVYSMNGIVVDDSLSLKSKLSENDYLLRSRGFHWIQEYPFNR